MSAFMVSDEAFAEVARFLVEDRPDIFEVKHGDLKISPVEFVECLRVMNRHSLIARYPGEKAGTTRYPDMLDALPLKPIDIRSVHNITDVQCVKQLRCIAYQSCETPRWEALRDFVDVLCDEICELSRRRDGMVTTPGYNEAAWGSANEQTKAKAFLDDHVVLMVVR